ncbi:MAG: hypothetical protein ACTSYD_14660 [Candidatus Heimdallarchaeaceae archaeon]
MNEQQPQQKVWSCTIETINKENIPEKVQLDFGDYDNLANQSFVLKKEYFEEFIEKIKAQENYSITGGLVEIISPDGKDFSKHSFFAILGVDKDNLLLGILIGELQDSSFKVVGYYPKELGVEYDENPNIIKNLAILLLKQDEMWEFVNLVAINPEKEPPKAE